MSKVGAKDGASGSPTPPPAEMNIAAELNDIYHATMVSTKGDKKAAERAKREAAPRIQQFAQLLNVARAGGKNAGAALKQARDTVKKNGDTTALDRWIHAHVDESVMRDAGLDPAEIAKTAGVVEKPDVEEAGRDYQDFKGEGGTVGPSGQGDDGVQAGTLPHARRV